MEQDSLRVGILDAHPETIDEYKRRLSSDTGITVLFSISSGQDLESTLDRLPVDVLLLDVDIPTSPANPNPYPILELIPRLFESHRDLLILVISTHTQRNLISAAMNAGASGYLLKDDLETLDHLAETVRQIAWGEIQLSKTAFQRLVPRAASASSRCSPRCKERSTQRVL